MTSAGSRSDPARGSSVSRRWCPLAQRCWIWPAAPVGTRGCSSNVATRSPAVDVDVSGLDDLRGHPQLEIVQADLENAPWPLPRRRFGAVVVTNYLWRPLFEPDPRMRSKAAACCSTRPSLAATRPMGARPIPSFSCSPGS